MESELPKSLWAYQLQGFLAVLFGVLVLVLPEITLFALILTIGIFLLLEGFLRIASSLTNRHESGWWLLLLAGLAGVIAGIFAIAWPGLTGLMLLLVIAVNALVSGVTTIWKTVRSWTTTEGKWLALLSGAVAIVFGCAALVWPDSTALTLTWLIGIYAIAFGVSQLAFTFVIRRK